MSIRFFVSTPSTSHAGRADVSTGLLHRHTILVCYQVGIAKTGPYCGKLNDTVPISYCRAAYCLPTSQSSTLLPAAFLQPIANSLSLSLYISKHSTVIMEPLLHQAEASSSSLTMENGADASLSSWLAVSLASLILALLCYRSLSFIEIFAVIVLAVFAYLYATRQLRQAILNHEASMVHLRSVIKRYKNDVIRHEDEKEGLRTINKRHYQENLELKLQIERLRAQLVVSSRAGDGIGCQRFHYDHPVAQTNRKNLQMVTQVNAQAKEVHDLGQRNAALVIKQAKSEELIARLEKETVRLRTRVLELSAGR